MTVEPVPFATTVPPVTIVLRARIAPIAHRATSSRSATAAPFAKVATWMRSPSSIAPLVRHATTVVTTVVRHAMTVQFVTIALPVSTVRTVPPVTIVLLVTTARIAPLGTIARRAPTVRSAETVMTVRRVRHVTTDSRVMTVVPLGTTVPHAATPTSTRRATRRLSTSPVTTSCSSACRRWRRPPTTSRA
jgi:hypothetical protein